MELHRLGWTQVARNQDLQEETTPFQLTMMVIVFLEWRVLA